MFYGLSTLRQVPPLAASEGAQAAVLVELSKEQLGPAVTVCWEYVGGLQGCGLAEKLQALHSAGTSVSKVQSLEGELCPSF